ncbi:fumarylacetoacetate hydrolase family protein [Alteromonas sp. CI.11.F.A3]|uniref:fumarylacetoacetate hydrolase family protein n=1 Tax=Alteromonas sp. CI.11.F.A3 TaxID=3079555 RepID=UPI002941C4B3|nr:fumarylacetoacetate hydrolase family protein [Alteromonas sp. CI.11.F.A3]WOI36372.1 fumarylacetoacetate hydrolase family protein [Alteromonas sp. CI.11.F.A3]
MKLASLKTDHPDGKLIIVSHDQALYVDVSDIAATMQSALENWSSCCEALTARYQSLNNGEAKSAAVFAGQSVLAPLPRAWQWLDGSLFLNHGHLMQQAFHLDPIADADKFPLVYQGAGDSFLGARDDIVVADLKHGIDFEGEFGVIVDAIPMGCSAQEALSKIRLVVLLNDISYRALGPREMKTGFGFVQAKGATAFAPIALTPDELGEHWQNGRVCLPLQVTRNSEAFGQPDGQEMHFGFHELIAHVAQTRPINAGTVFGSGTVSNADPSKGQACISELRAKEMIQHGAPQTPFMQQDEVVEFNVFDTNGNSLFGAIEQRVTASNKSENQ